MLVMMFLLPYVTHAQGAGPDSGLRATIKAAIMADPRAADLPDAQIEAMVDSLEVEAQAKGMTAEDILWRPVETPPAQTAEALGLPGVPFLNVCGNETSILCRLNHAFGLDGTNLMIPLVLGITAALLMLVIAVLILHHKHEQVTVNPPPPLF